jgi:Zn-dependent protease
VVVPLISMFYGGFLIGWAKPCPVTLRNFKNVRRGDILTSLAGPASNLAMASIALVLLVGFKHAGGAPTVYAAMDMAHGYPVDSAALRLFPLALLLYYGVTINLLLFVFNLFPIPPLDGSHVLRNFLPYEVEKVYNQIGMFGLILIFLVGGRFISAFYYPLLGMFNHVLDVL